MEENTVRFKRFPTPQEKIEQIAQDFGISKEEATQVYLNMLGMAIDIVKNENK